MRFSPTEKVVYAEGLWQIRKESHWPVAPFIVYGVALPSRGFERFAGGFWTKRGAKKYIDEYDWEIE